MRDAHSGRGEPGSLCSTAVSSLSTEELSLELIDEYIKEKEAEYPPNQMIAETLKLVPRSTNPELLSSCRALEVSPINDTKPLEMPLSSCSQAEPRPSERMQSVTMGVHIVPPPCDRSLESWCIKPAPQSLSPCSYSSLSCNALSVNDALEALQLPTPELKITEQPKQRGMRFRYECEGRSAGSILGENSTDQSKIMPAIEVLNCDNLKEVKLMACLVWKDSPYRVHPHSLVGKDCHDGICEVTIKPKLKRTHSFHNLGIQCVRKKEIEDAVEKKLKLGIDPFNAGHWKNHEEVDMNVVRLCFQAYFQDSSGNTQTLGPILSEPIYDKKSTNTSELKICRMNKETGQCVGGEEVYLLCDKVQKEDIAVVFKRDCWEAQADFSQADVHRQIAIVFKTPPYQDLEIGEPVTVNVYLQRLTDSVCSEPCAFTYLPKDHDTYGVDQKRKLGFPDVMGELSCPDPHGIEAKRRMKKPTYKKHLFSDFAVGAIMPFSQLCSMEQPSISEFFSRTGNALSQAKDSFLDYDCFSKSQSLTSYMDTRATEVSLSAINGAQDEDLQQEFFFDPLYGYVGSIPENLLSSDTTNSSNIAHLVGNSLRASECQEDVASYHMKEI